MINLSLMAAFDYSIFGCIWVCVYSCSFIPSFKYKIEELIVTITAVNFFKLKAANSIA